MLHVNDVLLQSFTLWVSINDSLIAMYAGGSQINGALINPSNNVHLIALAIPTPENIRGKILLYMTSHSIPSMNPLYNIIDRLRLKLNLVVLASLYCAKLSAHAAFVELFVVNKHIK